MVSQQTNLDVIANNLANVNTTAFRSQRAEFQDLVYQTIRASGATGGGEAATPSASQIGLGSKFTATSTLMEQGSPVQTGDPHNLLINGNGFFKITMPSGETAYTRDGTFTVDTNGQLVTQDGYQVQPGITIPAQATALTISNNGTVSATLPGNTDPTQLGNITLAMFANPAGLTRVGQNLYMAGGASGAEQEVVPGENGSGILQQGFVEGSNVQVVSEMIAMITAQRAYEINSKAIQTSDEMLQTLNGLKR